MNVIMPFINVHPGEFIKEELDERGWTQEDLAAILDMSAKSISHIINGKQRITLDTARMLSRVFGQSPQYWIHLDVNYRLRLQEKDDTLSDVEIKSTIFTYMPIKEMIRRKWISSYKTVSELQQHVCRYWNISRLDLSFLENEAAGLYCKKSEAYRQFTTYFALTWFQKARTTADRILAEQHVTAFNKDTLMEITHRFSRYTIMRNGVVTLLSDLNKSGVLFFVLSHLPGTYVDAASFCCNGQPVIVYTARCNRIDNFWFAAAHEIAHILYDLRSEDDYFIDEMDRNTADDKEKKANEFAAALLKHAEIIDFFKDKRHYISEYRVRQCADQLQIDPGIVVGALQYNAFLSYRNLNKFKEKITDKIPEAYLAEK